MGKLNIYARNLKKKHGLKCFHDLFEINRLFRFYILFSQCKSSNDTQEAWSFALLR